MIINKYNDLATHSTQYPMENHTCCTTTKEQNSKTDVDKPKASSGTVVTRVNPSDVLFGRGAMIDRNPGNVQFREIVRKHKSQYADCKTRDTKHQVAMAIYEIISVRNGCFLRKAVQEITPSWIVVDVNDALAKIKQALRERSENDDEEEEGLKPVSNDHGSATGSNDTSSIETTHSSKVEQRESNVMKRNVADTSDTTVKVTDQINVVAPSGHTAPPQVHGINLDSLKRFAQQLQADADLVQLHQQLQMRQQLFSMQERMRMQQFNNNAQAQVNRAIGLQTTATNSNGIGFANLNSGACFSNRNNVPVPHETSLNMNPFVHNNHELELQQFTRRQLLLQLEFGRLNEIARLGGSFRLPQLCTNRNVEAPVSFAAATNIPLGVADNNDLINAVLSGATTRRNSQISINQFEMEQNILPPSRLHHQTEPSHVVSSRKQVDVCFQGENKKRNLQIIENEQRTKKGRIL